MYCGMQMREDVDTYREIRQCAHYEKEDSQLNSPSLSKERVLSSVQFNLPCAF